MYKGWQGQGCGARPCTRGWQGYRGNRLKGNSRAAVNRFSLKGKALRSGWLGLEGQQGQGTSRAGAAGSGGNRRGGKQG